MPKAIVKEPVPIETGADDFMRVRGTRVPVETVVHAFRDGATAEEIAQRYSSLSLADVYQVIGYYLRHRAEMDACVAEREELHDEARRENESRWPADGVRERLMARRRA
ncbi:MAG: DUF433 domain-containing protein [Acidobacteria bacterium]|nr:DUF433 domain-containing protein [Acidobacteriota bacterium]